MNRLSRALNRHIYATYLRGRLVFVGLPASVQVILIFAGSRLMGFALFSLVGRQQLVSPWGSGPLSYLDFISMWDAGWYKQIATDGYPAVLPLDSRGAVQQNTWAFYPLFPLTAAALSRATGLGYDAAAATLALASGFVAALLIFRLFWDSLNYFSAQAGASMEPGAEGSAAFTENRWLALWAVAVFACAPVSPVLQVPYAESFNLIFLALTLLFLVRGKWWLAAACAVLACLSRPVGVPLGATAGLLWVWHSWQSVRELRGQNFTLSAALFKTLRKTAGQLISALLICVSALLWPLFAWLRTGRIDAYTATETAWRGSDLALFMPWIEQAQTYFGVLGFPLLLILITTGLLVLSSKPVRQTLHPALVLWCAAYALYLLLFLNPQSSLFRMLLPLFPLCLPLVALSASRAYRVLLLVSGAALQFSWVGWLWHWKQLPGGGDYPP